MTLIAKPIVKDQLWVITDGINKIGNVEALSLGFEVRIGDNRHHYDSTRSIEKDVHIKFESPKNYKKQKSSKPFAKWPTDGETYNDFYDLKRKLHVFTKTKDSKCYHAAGYFRIKMNNDWETVLCPKYIFIQRYPYRGPFHLESEAEKE